jgi:hypothetical protein
VAEPARFDGLLYDTYGKSCPELADLPSAWRLPRDPKTAAAEELIDDPS